MPRDTDAPAKRSLAYLLDMPLTFLGFALWRAWVSLSYANPVCPMPVNMEAGHFAYDVVLSACALGLAALSSRIAPLAGQRWTYPTIAVLLGFSAAANALAASRPDLAGALVVPATLAGGAGSALLILLWCEIYSCLGAARVALYYALTIIGGVLLTFVLQGFRDGYLYGALIALPALSAALAHRSYHRHIAPEDRPAASTRCLIPWKFFLILALFELVASYSSAHIRGDYPALIGSHSTWTTLVGGVVLFVWVWWFANRLPLSTLYRAPAILICCGLLAVPLFGIGGTVVGSFCTALGVMLFNALVLLFLCDVAKRFGVSALLLFGIEEALLLVGWLGRGAADILDGQGLFGALGPAVGAVATVAVIAVVTLLVLNKREIDERWGMAFLGKRPPEEDDRARLAHRCAVVAERGRLTPREGEVLELLAEGKSLSGVAGELIIAEGTAKAHTRHIYEKLGINSRQELMDLLMVEA